MIPRIAVGITIVAISFVLAGWAVIQRRKAKHQYSWVRVAARVVHASLGLGGGFDVDIAYEYLYEGKKYIGTKLHSLAVTWVFPSKPNALLKKYLAGATISVFVDPANPSNAVIEPGGDPKHLTLFLTIAAFGLLAAIKIIVTAT